MNDFAVFWVVLVGASFAFTYFRAQAQRDRIVAYLTELGAHNIHTYFHFLDFDRTNLTFDVSYQDAAGEYHSTVCKVRRGWIHDQKLYWGKVPQSISSDAPKQVQFAISTEEASAITKNINLEYNEIRIKNLEAENSRLRTLLQDHNINM